MNLNALTAEFVTAEIAAIEAEIAAEIEAAEVAAFVAELAAIAAAQDAHVAEVDEADARPEGPLKAALSTERLSRIYRAAVQLYPGATFAGCRLPLESQWLYGEGRGLSIEEERALIEDTSDEDLAGGLVRMWQEWDALDAHDRSLGEV